MINKKGGLISTENPNPSLNEPSLSHLALSIAHSAVSYLDEKSDNPENNKSLAKYHIDLLLLLQEKTKNNLDKEEEEFLTNLIKDLQLKYVQKS